MSRFDERILKKRELNLGKLSVDQIHTLSVAVTHLPIKYLKTDNFYYIATLKEKEQSWTKVEPIHNNIPSLIMFTPIDQQTPVGSLAKLIITNTYDKPIIISSSDIKADFRILKHCMYGMIDRNSKLVYEGHVEETNKYTFIPYRFYISKDNNVTLFTYEYWNLDPKDVLKEINKYAEFNKLATI